MNKTVPLLHSILHEKHIQNFQGEISFLPIRFAPDMSMDMKSCTEIMFSGVTTPAAC
jgi:hypothetical protein